MGRFSPTNGIKIQVRGMSMVIAVERFSPTTDIRAQVQRDEYVDGRMMVRGSVFIPLELGSSIFELIESNN